MINYNGQNSAYLDRIKKELWSKGEMAELQQKLKDTKLAKKYGLPLEKDQLQVGRSKLDIAQFFKELQDKDSDAATSITGNTRRFYEKLITKSKWHKKDKQDCSELAELGRLGNYVIGETLEDRLERRNRG